MKKWLNKVTLEGSLVQLVPMNADHKSALLTAAADGKLWNLWYTSVPSHDTIDAYIDSKLRAYEEDTFLPFVVIDKKTNQVIGSTSYLNASAENRRLEIGYTWYAKSYHKTGFNTECKYLLLSHAFQQLNCIAVEFRTHIANEISRAAITRLGAKQDGILRNHRILKDGSYRDSVIFSILESEWADVKVSLEKKMRQTY